MRRASKSCASLARTLVTCKWPDPLVSTSVMPVTVAVTKPKNTKVKTTTVATAPAATRLRVLWRHTLRQANAHTHGHPLSKACSVKHVSGTAASSTTSSRRTTVR